MSVQAGGKDSVVLTTTKTRKQNKPASTQHKYAKKKDFSWIMQAIHSGADLEAAISNCMGYKTEVLSVTCILLYCSLNQFFIEDMIFYI